MLAREAGAPFDDPGFLFEIKWDGYRALVERTESGRVHLWSRSGRDLGRDLPALAASLTEVLATPCLLDGEIVALHEGRSDFPRLLRRVEPIVYVVFDLLRWRSEDLVGLPLRERRARLVDRIVPSDRLLISEGVVGVGTGYFASVCALGLEGMVAKELRSPYRPGIRSAAWRKVLNLKEGTFSVVAAEASDGDHLAAVYVADGEGRTVARVAGLPPAAAHAVRARAGSALAHKTKAGEQLLAVAPGLRCRVRYRSVLPDGKLRHPVYAGLFDEAPGPSPPEGPDTDKVAPA